MFPTETLAILRTSHMDNPPAPSKKGREGKVYALLNKYFVSKWITDTAKATSTNLQLSWPDPRIFTRRRSSL